jgi:hypothetical protein
MKGNPFGGNARVSATGFYSTTGLFSRREKLSRVASARQGEFRNQVR